MLICYLLLLLYLVSFNMASNTAEIGGYSCQFVDDNLPDEFLCQICQLVQRDPHQVICCGRIFCKQCLEELKQRKIYFTCPNCRESLVDNYFKDVNTDRKIRHLLIYCTNKDNGCEWVGALKDLQEHVVDCPSQLVECKNGCGEYIPRCQHDHHVKNECPRRKSRCKNCRKRGEYAYIRGEHLTKCPDLLLACSNEGCTKLVKRCLLIQHQLECPMEVIQCPYASVGCQIKVKREDVPLHETEYMAKHLKMAMSVINELKASKHLVPNDSVVIKLPNYVECEKSKNFWYSSGFYSSSGGYKICLCVDVNGCGEALGTHLSCYVCLMSGEYDDTLEWPFQGVVTVELLNQLEDKNHHLKTTVFNDITPNSSKQRIIGKDYGVGFGQLKFISQDLLKNQSPTNCEYLVDNTLYFRVSVNITSKTKPWLSGAI